MPNSSRRATTAPAPATSAKPRLGRRRWEEEDKERVLNIVQKAIRLQEEAYNKEVTDLATLRQVSDFVMDVVLLRDLYDAFMNSPHRKIDGRGGVKELLGLSRNGVYFRLRAFGLDPADFQEPDRPTLSGLITKVSKKTGKFKTVLDKLDKPDSTKKQSRRAR